MSKSKQQEAQDLLNDLDSLPAPPPVNRKRGSSPAPGAAPGAEGAEALAFLDEITQKSSEPTKSTPAPVQKPTERIRLSAGNSARRSVDSSRATTPLSRVAPSSTPPPSTSTSQTEAAESTAPAAGGSSWGWGNVWSGASAALQQARSVVEEQAKHLPPVPAVAAARAEHARKWGEGMMEYVKTTQFDKISQDLKNVSLSTLTEIMNAVAPPISEHEVIQVWLSHDMEGYEGIESLVYRSLAKIMEQVEGGDLIVNRGNESRPKEGLTERDLNALQSYEEAIKLAEAEIAELVKVNSSNVPAVPKSPTLQNPTTYSTIYIRVQPFFSSEIPTTIPSLPGVEPPETPQGPRAQQQQLQFLLYLVDPSHDLAHATTTQGVSAGWLGLWDAHDWVESTVVEVLRVGVEVLGQHYVADRMGYAKRAEIEALVAEKTG